MNRWEEAAKYCEETYGIFVDWDERFFECPECGEPLYFEDWPSEEFVTCPICEFHF